MTDDKDAIINKPIILSDSPKLKNILPLVIIK